MYNKIRFDRAASLWEEALPIGNGSFGAMVWGGPDIHRYSINADTFWSNSVRDDSVPNRAAQIKKHRELIESRQFVEAEKQAWDELECLNPSALYMPLGDIVMEKISGAALKGCVRELNLQTATVEETYSYYYPRKHTCRTYIAKDADVLVSELHFDYALSYAVSFTNHLPKTVKSDEDGLCFIFSAPDNARSVPIIGEPKKQTISAGVYIKVITDGTLSVHNNEFFIQNATHIVLLAATETNFVAWNKYPDKEKDLFGITKAKIEKALETGLDKVYEEHVQAHRALYDRVTLELPFTKPDTFTADAERFEASNEAIELMFNFGRYLLITSSAPGAQPANLQGIWNNKFIPPWCSGYTSNINLEMNYWLAEPANLSECHEPLMQMLRELREAGKQSARDYYDCGGWVAHHNIDIWRKCSPADGYPQHAVWPMGSGWLCEHLWTHYAYTQDEDFLKETAYPITKEAVQFYLDFLYEDKNGQLVTIPSVSPENAYDIDGNRVAVTKMCAMDKGILFELFENFMKMTEILGISDDFTEKVKASYSKLAPYKIGSDGRLLEWDEEFIEIEKGHRHLSHLYGLYPGNTLVRDEKLKEAAKRSLECRLENGGGHTGWSCGWIILLWAALKNGEKAKQYVDHLLQKSSFPNLFDAHPPFQIDGNFAFSTGIIHMLMQSRFENDEIVLDLLPACPNKWNKGALKGVCAVGGLTVDLEWNEQNVTVKIQSDTPKKVHILCGDKKASVLVDGTLTKSL
ncbi:MAG: glycoside hydrolase N-terminal domain-containing protein [Clostridia bacterium]|nr:glycoside hydrolase N-terminal domain-containing protein [Clostridia bacterium]